MTYIDTVVVGAGHAGLAVSRLLAATGHEHVVLERGRVGERWRTERWDSLHLLTPNWMNRLPGWEYRPPAPDAYLSAGGFVRLLDRYAASFDAPVIESANVEEVSRAPRASGHRYLVVTDQGTWRTRQVVVATGPHGTPIVPAHMQAGGAEVVTSAQYRNPAQLPSGGVLVVGASASGVQIADELARAGRPVVLAVGRHTRMPRRYRGMDIFWWLSNTGRLSRTVDDVRDVSAARQETSMQLVGRNDPELSSQDLDLAALQANGVRLAGRLERLTAGRATFRDDLPDTVAAADRRMHRFLDAVDDHVERVGLGREVWSVGATPRRRRSFRYRVGRPARRGDRHRPACHRLSAAPSLASAAGHGAGREHRAVPRRHRRSRCVRRRPTVPAPARLRVHPRCPARRVGGRGPPARPGRGRAERGAGGMNGYDVVVVGGRVAGASTALLLARAGVRVALVERSSAGS